MRVIAMGAVAVAGIGLLLFGGGLPELRRYLKIRSM